MKAELVQESASRARPANTLPQVRYSRFPWINNLFGRSTKSFTAAVQAYTELVRADRDRMDALVEHQVSATRLYNLDAIVETEHLKLHRKLAEERRVARTAELEDELLVARLESELETARFRKEIQEERRKQLRERKARTEEWPWRQSPESMTADSGPQPMTESDKPADARERYRQRIAAQRERVDAG